MCLEHLVPPPYHVPLRLVRDAVRAAEHESFVRDNVCIARRNSAGVDGLGVRALEPEEYGLRGVVAG